MEITEITAFVHTAETASFTTAGVRLGITPSGISKAISRLEAELGVRLLQRTTRQLKLTQDGTTFLQHARQLLSDFDRMRQMLQPVTAEPAGLMRISLPTSFGRMIMMPLITRWAERHSQLSLDISLTDRKVDLVDEGFDVAVRIGTLPDTQLVARRVSVARRLVCAAPAYIHRHGRPLAEGDLDARECIGYRSTNTHRPKVWHLRDVEGTRIEIKPDARMMVDNGDALLEVALAGAGIVSLHGYMARDAVAQGKLIVLFESDPLENDPISVVYPSSRHLSPKVRAFVDMLATELPEQF